MSALGSSQRKGAQADPLLRSELHAGIPAPPDRHSRSSPPATRACQSRPLAFRCTGADLPPSQSPELLAILASIQLQQDRASYASMTSILGPQYISSLPLNDAFDPAVHGGKTKTMAEEWMEVRRQVGAIINVGASMMTVATGVWWVGGGRSVQAVSFDLPSRRSRGC